MTSKTPYIVEPAQKWEGINMFVSDERAKYYSFAEVDTNPVWYVYRVHNWDIDNVNTETDEALYIEQEEEKTQETTKKEREVVIYTKETMQKNILVNKLRRWESQKIELNEWYLYIKYLGRNMYSVFMTKLSGQPLIGAEIKYKYNIIKFCREVWIEKATTWNLDNINTLKYKQ